ncbi:MAG: fasciclin domain-containing protein, partial [Flavobacteriales bacterium]|nr:fasciclin domain-containing protein [Flavobacteriales bacterium]
MCININAQWGFTLYDALNELTFGTETNNNDPCCAMSGYAFQGFNMEQLDDENSTYTVFVPNQQAVEGVLELLNLNMWDGLNFSDMVPALNYHIVPGIWMAADLEDGMSLLTLEGQSLIVSIGSGVRVDEANVIQTDIIADNGVIHVIDATLAPAGYPEATVVQVVVQSDAHTSFAQGITNAYLTDYLSAQALEADDDNNGDPLPGPFTVFAPTDDAINMFAATYGFVDVESFLTSQYVDEFIERHIVIGNYMSTDLSDGQTLTSLSGEPVTLSIGVDGIQASGAEVEVADLLAYNGVVHSIGSVLPFDIPTVEGTCGTWTINLYNASDWEDWGGSTVDIYVDGIMIASETNNELAIDEDFNGIPEALGTSTFSFAVNEGSVIDVLFTDTNGSGWPSYEVVDETGNVLFETVYDTNFGAGSVFGLKPCDTDFSCGY